MAEVGVVILNWRNWKDTVQCLTPFLDFDDEQSLQIFLIDNGSNDDSVEHLTEFLSQQKSKVSITFLQNQENLGFAGGCNSGIEKALEANCEYVFLLNNDAWMDPRSIKKLVAVSKVYQDALVCSVVGDEEGKVETFSGRKFPQMIFGFDQSIARNTHERVWASDYLEGSALLLPRKFLLERYKRWGHYFDSSLFLYCEDLDLCLAAKSLGYPVLLTDLTLVYHGGSKSGGGFGNRFAYYYITRNRFYIAQRWLSSGLLTIFYPYYIFSRILLQIIRFRRPQVIRHAVWRGLIDGLKGKKGKWDEHG